MAGRTDVADFPDVPDVPGVPAIPRDPNAAAQILVLLTSDAVDLFSGPSSQQWGLFQNGEPVVVCDNVLAFGFQQRFDASDYQVEDGGFETYNKVQEPFDVRLRFSTGGSTAAKQAFIASIAAIIASTDLFDGVTPEQTYSNINPVFQSYDRSAVRGLGLMTIDVHCIEIRPTGQTQFTTNTATSGSSASVTSGSSAMFDNDFGAFQNTSGAAPLINDPQSPSASPQVSGGTVQPTTPSANDTAAFSSALKADTTSF